MANKSPKAHRKKYKNTGLSLPDCLPLTFTENRLRRKKKSLLCMRYRPSAMGSESQLKSGGGRRVFPTAFTVSEELETQQLSVSREEVVGQDE